MRVYVYSLLTLWLVVTWAILIKIGTNVVEILNLVSLAE